MFLYSAVTVVALLLAARDNQQRREIGVVLPLEATEHLFDVAALERFSEVLRAGVRLANRAALRRHQLQCCIWCQNSTFCEEIDRGGDDHADDKAETLGGRQSCQQPDDDAGGEKGNERLLR